MTEARLIRPGRHGAIFGFAGWSGSGKTTLVEKVISYISASGVDVATIKHAHHHFDADGVQRVVSVRVDRYLINLF